MPSEKSGRVTYKKMSARTYPKLAEVYHLRREKEVESFLQENPYLAPLLIEAHEHIEAQFGEEAPVVLEVLHDPEAENGAQLFALIQTKLPGEEARMRRAQLYKEWWLQNSLRACCQLHIDLEYV